MFRRTPLGGRPSNEAFQIDIDPSGRFGPPLLWHGTWESTRPRSGCCVSGCSGRSFAWNLSSTRRLVCAPSLHGRLRSGREHCNRGQDFGIRRVPSSSFHARCGRAARSHGCAAVACLLFAVACGLQCWGRIVSSGCFGPLCDTRVLRRRAGLMPAGRIATRRGEAARNQTMLERPGVEQCSTHGRSSIRLRIQSGFSGTSGFWAKAL